MKLLNPGPVDFSLTPEQRRFYDMGRSIVLKTGLRSGRTAAVVAVIAASVPTPEDAEKIGADLREHGWAMQAADGSHVPIPSRTPPVIVFDQV